MVANRFNIPNPAKNMDKLYRYLVLFFFIILIIVSNTGLNFKFDIEVPSDNSIYNEPNYQYKKKVLERNNGTKEEKMVKIRKRTDEERRIESSLLTDDKNYSKYYWNNRFRPTI